MRRIFTGSSSNAMQCPDQDPIHLPQPNVLFIDSWRCYPGNLGFV
jgi:hypothetical protein